MMKTEQSPRRGNILVTRWGRLLGVLGILLTFGIAPAQALDCEIPLFVQQSLMGANVMILADNSGSMNQAVYHLNYDSDTTYAGNFTSESLYYISKAEEKTPKDFDTTWPDVPRAELVVSDNGQNGTYPGNYLNWIYFHATDAERLDLPLTTRIQVLKEVLCQIIDNGSSQLNFGLTIFQNESGGNVVAKCGTNPVSIKATINGLTANTWTPLGESLETLVDYWNYDGPDAAIQSWCQYSFNLVITDGLPTMDTEVSAYLHDADGDGNDPGNCTSIGAPYPDTYNCSDHIDDVAYYMAHEDLRPDLESDQFVPTYVVGFHENGDLLHETATNGDGLFFLCDNAVELYASIDFAIQDIMRRISSGSAVAVVSTEQGDDDRLYRGKFMPLDWDGYLECYTLPMEANKPALWEAGSILASRDPSTRRIATALGSTVYDFTAGNASDLAAAMGAADETEAENLINWARGNDVEGLRNRRGWRLGDIVHSTPVVVGAPANYTPEETYQAYYVDNKDRKKLVYVGANDGMLHAFDADTGEEAWAFVPQFALPDFASLADSGYCHTFTCDQTVTVKDAKLSGIWNTILVSGGREGGNAVFALNITDPDSPEVLWQKVLPNGHDFSSMVEAISISGRSVALVGSGLDEIDAEAWLYAYDLENGDLLSSRLLSTEKYRNKACRPAVVDYDLDGSVDLVYMADLGGSLWRMETNGSTILNNWDISELYTGDQPITAPPSPSFGPGGAIYIYFGTGAYLTEDDMMTADPQYFVGVFDHHDGSTQSLKTLVNQTDSIDDVSGSGGWYIELNQALGERVKGKAVVIAENVIFTSFAPTLDACAAGGESWLYKMAYDDAGLLEDEEQENPEDRVLALGQGIASHPVVDLAQGQVVIQSSDASITVNDIATEFLRLKVRSWQEDFDYSTSPSTPEDTETF
ncbi:MAG: PQQ-binding-like beta-propeller repeat protein [Gemmatimonadales bacterium]|nr:PQQ-binding-like beta-propeller repeat protein [Gemmatimonadales bacterium]